MNENIKALAFNSRGFIINGKKFKYFIRLYDLRVQSSEKNLK